jgi:hypothetical protein
MRYDALGGDGACDKHGEMKHPARHSVAAFAFTAVLART